MSQLIEESNAHARVEQSEVAINALTTDSGALKKVVQNAERTEEYLVTKQKVLRWRECQRLYENPTEVKTWEGTNVQRAYVSVYTVAMHVQSILPQIVNGLFSDDPPFMIKPRYGTKMETSRAISELLHYQMEDCDFRQNLEDGIQSALVFGTGIWKWGWESYTRKRRIYERKAAPVTLNSPIPGIDPTEIHTDQSDEVESRDIDEQIERPYFENVDLHHIYVDPKLRVPDIRKARFVIHRMMVTAGELEQLRGFEGYDIPSKAELLELLFPPEEQAPTSRLENMQQYSSNIDFQAMSRDMDTNVDPTEDAKFELLEYWDNDEVIVTLNRKLVIRNEENPFGCIPYTSVNWWNVPNSFYGIGLAHSIGYEQLVQKGLINARLDQVSLNLNRPFIRVRGKNVPTQNIRLRPNAIYDIDQGGELKPMDEIKAVPEGFGEVQASEARAEAISGANEQMVQGNTPDRGRTSLGRTATGANLLAGGSQSRLEAFVERIGNQVFEPTLYAFHEMNAALLPPSLMKRILSDELQVAYQVDMFDIKNARVVFDILAGARMSQKRTMSQNLPFMMQTLITQPTLQMLTQQGKKVDINEMCNMVFDISAWKNKADLIVDMTDEDKQRVQQEAMQQQQLEGQKQDGRRQVIEDENVARTTREVLREGLRNQMHGVDQ